jgi:hypothetical protein
LFQEVNMLTNKAEAYNTKAETYSTKQARSRTVPADRSLQVVLWVAWTIGVLATAAWNWYLDSAAGQPLNVVGLSVYTVLVGLIGLLVVTLVERWFQPQRFVD